MGLLSFMARRNVDSLQRAVGSEFELSFVTALNECDALIGNSVDRDAAIGVVAGICACSVLHAMSSAAYQELQFALAFSCEANMKARRIEPDKAFSVYMQLRDAALKRGSLPDADGAEFMAFAKPFTSDPAMQRPLALALHELYLRRYAYTERFFERVELHRKAATYCTNKVV